jgi:hypothetical protein
VESAKVNDVAELVKTLNPSSLRADAGKFEAKLTFAERCAVLGCHKLGVNRRLLALSFGVNRRTVTHIYNPKSPHYRSVRNEYNSMGHDDFIEKYVTDDIYKKLKETEAKAENQAILNADDSEASVIDTNLREPSKMRTRDEGFHTIQPEHCKYSHRIEVRWVNSYLGEGWYFRDMDGPNPNEWMNNGPESILSSTAALRGAESEVIDVT